VAAAQGVPDLRGALFDLHRPPSLQEHERGRDRFIFEEFFTYELSLLLNRRKRDTLAKGPRIQITDAIREKVRRALPFKLTQGQKDAVREIVLDMASGKPMQRLLQGDVGCGKTIVAAIASVVALENRFQTAYMAPTSILAEQHFERLAQLFSSSGYVIRLLTGGTPASEKKEILKGLKDGTIHFAVGTHALLEAPVEFRDLGLCIVDEEHRFGVHQRQVLKEKGETPHYLVMSATPIPRTLTLTIYGDMDVSSITEMPPGRLKIRTYLRREAKRPEIYGFIRKQVREGRQAFLVYPLIEESENFDAKALTVHYDEVAAAFPDLTVGMMHGRLPYREKDAAMKAFASGATHILVSTTVIEVGVDVPNAAVMVVENAERFGLSQLHQLRGRIGRSSHKSYCILIAGTHAGEESLKRLQIFEKNDDGFVLAEEDLNLRGPGDLLGLRQWGLPRFRAADIFKDRETLIKACKAARGWLDAQPLPECEVLLKRLLKLWKFEEKII
jgi:ATP-dependent DNA helicase RecG